MTSVIERPQRTATASAAGKTTVAAVGLSKAAAQRRLAEYGENALAEHRVSALERLARFFWGPILWMIEIAAVLSAVLGHRNDFAIILTMLFINAGVGFWQAFKADNAIALLKQRLALKALVSFLVASAVKIGTYKLLNHHPRQAQQLARVENRVAP